MVTIKDSVTPFDAALLKIRGMWLRRNMLLVFASLGLCIFSSFRLAPTGISSSTSVNLNYDLAKLQSFGFFDNIPENDWKLRQKIVEEHVNHKFVDEPLTHNPKFDKRIKTYFNSYFAWYQCNYEPNFSCGFERRIGGNGNGDGPKWICDPHQIARLAKERKEKDPNHPGCVIYSIGSNGDFQFEVGMQQSVGVGTCEFHIFDKGDYETKMPKELERAHYHKWHLKKQEDVGNKAPLPGQDSYGLIDTVKLLGHEKLNAIDVFKIDCEGCEWRSYKDWLHPEVPDLMQIQVELHKAPGQKAINLFDDLEQGGYVRFHKEANIQFVAGEAIEYAFLKLDKQFF